MIRHKDASVEKEFHELPYRNPRLYAVLRMLSYYCQIELKQDVVITEVYRDPATNAAQGGIANSPHLTWEAVDIRSLIYTPEEIEKIKNFLNCVTFRHGKQTCVFHQVPGGAPHFHIQVAL